MEYALEAGRWNWLGYPYLQPMPVETALSVVTATVQITVTDDGRLWVPRIGINTLGDMQPGEGYMVIVNEDVTFQHNRVILAWPQHRGLRHRVGISSLQ